MTILRRIEEKHPKIATMIILFCIMTLGAIIRNQFLQKSTFVINDGGMFMTMVKDLQDNGFKLPFFTTYNHLDIPYAYPPLSFYSVAILNNFLGIDLITLFRLFPLVFNLLSIPAFYLLAKELTGDYRLSLIATVFYSINIPGFEWLVSGGGITRSPSHTYLLISLWGLLRFYRTRNLIFYVLALFTGSLMILHHIEYTTMLIYSMVLFSFGLLSNREKIKYILFFLIGLGILTSPYWITIVIRYGASPFISAFHTANFDIAKSMLNLILLFFKQDVFTGFINISAIFGMLYSLFTKKYKLLLWFIAIILFNPRSATRLSTIPVSIFAAIFLEKTLFPVFDQTTGIGYPKSNNSNIDYSKPKLSNGNLFIGLAIIISFSLCFIYTFQNHSVLRSLQNNEITGLTWIKNNTPPNSQFIVLDPSTSWENDQLGEWFPTLTERKSITTVQGTEWLPNFLFESQKMRYSDLRSCYFLGELCLESWMKRNNGDDSYIFLSNADCLNNNNICLNFFAFSIRNSHIFQTIFENEDVIVFKRKADSS
jgi:hypothetical protein